jgi:hypothetical protein
MKENDVNLTCNRQLLNYSDAPSIRTIVVVKSTTPRDRRLAVFVTFLARGLCYTLFADCRIVKTGEHQVHGSARCMVQGQGPLNHATVNGPSAICTQEAPGQDLVGRCRTGGEDVQRKRLLHCGKS